MAVISCHCVSSHLSLVALQALNLVLLAAQCFLVLFNPSYDCLGDSPGPAGNIAAPTDRTVAEYEKQIEQLVQMHSDILALNEQLTVGFVKLFSPAFTCLTISFARMQKELVDRNSQVVKLGGTVPPSAAVRPRVPSNGAAQVTLFSLYCNP